MWDRVRAVFGLMGVLAVCAGAAQASGPRFVTGVGWSAGPGQWIQFYTNSPKYYTDPGDLSATVTHAQADAMVAAAAAPWNVQVSSLVLKQGGELAEHVSGSNVYFNGSDMVFPADVSASNYQNIPIAVIYDTDGSVIDTLLGEDASDPSGCRDTGVVESVDSIGTEGKIHHAMLILNGRCVGTTAEQLTQMQYQLERAFGRVIGLSWSQVNDNVFTGATAPSANAIAYWPIMHPIDVLCGPYSYQCITNPFQLRADDLNGLTLLYPVTSGNITGNEVLSSANAVGLVARVVFPTSQGMDWVNVGVRLQLRGAATTESFQVASVVTGYLYQQNVGNPVTGQESAVENVGDTNGTAESEADFARVPDNVVENAYMTTEAIDPLYTDEYAIAPYERPPVTPSGSPVTLVDWSAIAGTYGIYQQTASNAASSCSPGSDGTQSAPAASNASGWWTGLLCGVGHSSWWSVAVNAGSSWTIEVTATDETGAPTMSKAQPVIGVWNTGDTGLPTVASQPASMNAMTPGVTQLMMPAGTTPGSFKFAVADQYGGGRPDFTYQARVLYVAGVSPSQVSSAGGQIVVNGEGFRQGNLVYVNGVPATVVSWSANQIVAQAPSMAAAGESLGTAVDVMVVDAATGGETDIANGFTYAQVQPDELSVVSAPASLETGVTAGTPFAVELLQPNGVTPIANASVQLSVKSGTAALGVCSGTTTCVVQTNAAGVVSSTVTGGAAGTVVLTATEVNGTAAALVVTLVDANPVRTASVASPAAYVAAGGSGSWTIQVGATQDGAAAVGVPVVWTASGGVTLSSGGTVTEPTGSAAVTVSANQMSSGTATVTGCVWSTVCASWTVTAVSASQWMVAVSAGAGQSVVAGTALGPVTVTVTDGAGHALAGATVSVYQTTYGWEGTCPTTGRCAAAPVLASSQSTAVSDDNGNVAVTPLEVSGLPQVVNIAVVTGTQGFCSLSLPVTP